MGWNSIALTPTSQRPQKSITCLTQLSIHVPALDSATGGLHRDARLHAGKPDVARRQHVRRELDKDNDSVSVGM
eukprot:766853-Hanusia_phi.AAC.6